MLLSSTFSPSSIVLPDLTRVANNSVPGSRRNSPISLKNSCPPPTYIVGDLCSTLQLYKNDAVYNYLLWSKCMSNKTMEDILVIIQWEKEMKLVLFQNDFKNLMFWTKKNLRFIVDNVHMVKWRFYFLRHQLMISEIARGNTLSIWQYIKSFKRKQAE